MHIHIYLCWDIQATTLTPKLFKSSAAYELVKEFSKRLEKYGKIKIIGTSLDKFERPRDTRLWFCDLGTSSKSISSEDLAHNLEKILGSGLNSWSIVIGPHNGFAKTDYDRLKPDFSWSFGPLTFPHELAAVICCEQLYRAWTIIKNHPYHGGHFKV